MTTETSPPTTIDPAEPVRASGVEAGGTDSTQKLQTPPCTRLQALFAQLMAKFATRADPDTWWPVYFGRTDPPRFERAITNVLVQNSSWSPVQRAVEALDRAGLLTARSLAEADLANIADCVKPTGLQKMKAERLQGLGAFVVRQFGTELAFCDQSTREDLLELKGIGEETADRMVLYVCYRLAFPVDTYTRRVLVHHGIIPRPVTKPTAKQKRDEASLIRRLVEAELPRTVEVWRRLHALMQLEGSSL